MPRRPATAARTLAAGLAIGIAVGGAPREASATWHRIQDVPFNSAYILEPGETVIGIFTPLTFGVAERVQLALHPVLALLLTPDLQLGINALMEPVAVSVTLGYAQTFITEAEGGGFPGTVDGGVLVTVPFLDQIALTGYLGYRVDFATRDQVELTRDAIGLAGDAGVDLAVRETRDRLDTELVDHGLVYGVGLNGLIDPKNLLMAQLRATFSSRTLAHETPLVTLLYAHAFDRTRLGVGAAFGRFPIRTGSGSVITLPAYPVVDVWVRF